MEIFEKFFKGLSRQEQIQLCADIGMNHTGIKTIISRNKKLGLQAAIKIEKATNGAVLAEQIRPEDADLIAYLRGK